MKRILTALVFMVLFNTMGNAQTLFGGGLQYYAEGKDIGLQVKSEIGLDDSWALGGSAAYVLAKGSPFLFDLDALYRIVRINESTILAPLAGLNIANFKSGEDRKFDLGINIGAELMFPIQERYIYVQPKYVVLGNKGFVISAGIFL